MRLSFFKEEEGWAFPLDVDEAQEVALGRAAADEFVSALDAGLPPDALALIGEAGQDGTYAEWSFWMRLQEHFEALLARALPDPRPSSSPS
jgi:hypothetical protein